MKNLMKSTALVGALMMGLSSFASAKPASTDDSICVGVNLLIISVSYCYDV